MLLLALLVGRASMAAPGCDAMFNDLRGWLNQSSQNRVSMELTIHQSNSTVSYFGSRVLNHDGVGNGEYYKVTGTQLFNDRVSGGQPFNFLAADNLTIFVVPAGAQFDLILSSWGDVRMDYPATMCTGNELVAISNSAVATMSFTKTNPIQ